MDASSAASACSFACTKFRDVVEHRADPDSGSERPSGARWGRLAKWLVAAAVVQFVLLWAIVLTATNSQPDEETLDALGEGFVAQEVGPIRCGNSDTYDCQWMIVIAHQGSEADVADELSRIGLSLGRVDNVGDGTFEVHLSWVGNDPSWPVITAVVLLFVGAPLSLVLGLAIYLWRWRSRSV